ncbi:MAG: Uma2 family endonuclease [Acetobacteraceae bacterium]|nr:Uma2 family endonuclease [Acetobacteraceae bacterium]
MSATAKVPLRMSVQEFLAWDAADGLRYELVDGLPRAMAPASPVHGLLQSELGSLIRNHLRHHRPDCEIVANPGVVPRLLSAHNVRIPDLGVTCSPVRPGQATLDRPLLLVEITSPSNQADTWSNVWAYTSIPSVREVLVLSSTGVGAELLRRAEDGSWPERVEEFAAGGELVMESIGFRVLLSELYLRTGLAADPS